MKNFSDITVIDINNQLEVSVQFVEHDNPVYLFTVNGLPVQSKMRFGLLDDLFFCCKISNGAVEITEVTINKNQVLPVYLHLANPPTNWITTDWQFQLPGPFYPWYHAITGQGWIA